MSKLIDIDHLIESKNPRLKKLLPGFAIRYIKNIIHQDEVNEFIELNKNLKNEEFCLAVLNNFNVKVKIKGIENIPSEGGFIGAANHPLGGMDAMALVSVIHHKRKEIKFIVNDLLLHLENLKGMFQGVNKHGRNSHDSLKQVDNLFTSNHAVFVFPAGLVSRKIKGKIVDLEWKKTFVSRAVKYNKPIVPVYIDGNLSNFFYRLSKLRTLLGIKANIEMFYLVNEMFKQKNRTIKIYVGKPIYSSEIDNSKSHAEWAKYIKEEVYSLKEK